MSEHTSKKPDIADYVVARRKRKESFLDEIDRFIDTEPMENLLHKQLNRIVNAIGNSAYPPLPMFKIFAFTALVQSQRHACRRGIV